MTLTKAPQLDFPWRFKCDACNLSTLLGARTRTHALQLAVEDGFVLIGPLVFCRSCVSYDTHVICYSCGLPSPVSIVGNCVPCWDTAMAMSSDIITMVDEITLNLISSGYVAGNMSAEEVADVVAQFAEPMIRAKLSALILSVPLGSCADWDERRIGLVRGLWLAANIVIGARGVVEGGV